MTAGHDPAAAGDDRPGGFGAAALGAAVAASMIGAGVWTTSGFTLAALGSPGRVLLVWLLGGAVACCGAAAYGGLARAIRGSGGEYLFLSRAVHPLAGFLAGWVSLLAGFTAAAAFAALTLHEYLAPLLPGVLSGLPAGVTGAAALLGCGALHAATRRGGAGAQTAVVGVKLGLLAAFCGFAAIQYGRGRFAGGPSFAAPPPDAPRGWELIAAAAGQLVWVSLSYSGFNAAVYLAGEAKDPARTVPRAMLLGALAVTGIYLALNAAFVLAPPAAAVAGRPDVAAVAARFLGGEAFGPRLELAVRGVIALGLLTSVSALVQTGPRVYAAMAADGLFPLPGLFRLKADGSAPASAVLLQAGLAAGLCGSGATVAGLLDYLGLTLSLSAAGAVGCLFVLKRRGEPVATWRLACAAAFVAATAGLAGVKLTTGPVGPGLLGLVGTLGSGVALYGLLARFGGGGGPARAAGDPP